MTGPGVWSMRVSSMPAGEDARGWQGVGSSVATTVDRWQQLTPPTDASVIYKAPPMSPSPNEKGERANPTD